MGRLQRREFLARSFAVALLAALRAEAQARSYRLAILTGGTEASTASLRKVLAGTLDELGYGEGRNLLVERRYAEGRLERLPMLAEELVARKPDAIFAVGTQATLAALRATNSIPIVFAVVSDPVDSGIVKSLARPGTNATGFAYLAADITGKRLQLLKEIFPSASRMAVLHNPLNVAEVTVLKALRRAGAALALNVQVIEARSAEEIALAFRTLQADRPDVLYVIESPLTFSERALVVRLANGQRLPAFYGLVEFVEADGLMSYSVGLIEQYRAAASYIDKILKGAKPADLPVEQPTRFELVLNLKTAQAQGVKFPQSILLRADRVIE